MDFIASFVIQAATAFQTDWREVTRDELEAGTDKARDAGTSGSFIYVAYENDQVLYVGETSKSVKRRFLGDGSGSHKQKNAEWYCRVTKVKYIKKSHAEMPDMERRLLEQAFAIHFQPEFYK